MFKAAVYNDRRKKLRREMNNGIILIPGNFEVSFNYPANTYSFRQDSNFSYFFGLDHPDLAGTIDLDEGIDTIFGNDVEIDDIIWMGKQPSIKEQAAQAGVGNTEPLKNLTDMISTALKKGRKVHYLPPYRGETLIQLSELLGIHHSEIKAVTSEDLIRAVVKLRMVKDDLEVAEISRMVDVAFIMHTTAMTMAKPGVIEREIDRKSVV